MILCSVRIIIVFISLLAELSNPPVVFDQANQNISCGFSPGNVSLELSDLAISQTHSLSGYSTLLLQLPVELDSILYLHGNFTTPFTLEGGSCWAECTSNNMFAIALICASMVYVSLLSIIIYSIWTHTNRNKKLSRKIRITNATLSYMKSTNSVRNSECNKLKETRESFEKELQKLMTQSDTSEQLVAQAQEKLIMAKEELKKEQSNVIAEQKQLYSAHTKVLSGINGKVEDTQRQASLLQKLESKAIKKSTSLRKLLEKERKEFSKKQLLLSNAVHELQQELQNTKEAQRRYAMLELEGHEAEVLREKSDELCWDAVSRVAREQSLLSVQLIERKLRQTTSEIVKLNARFVTL